jgi:hypothetical protein
MLTVEDDELSVGDNEDVLSEAAKRWMRYVHMGGLWMITWLDLDFVMCATAGQLRSSERAQVLAGVTSTKDFNIFICYCYIHVLPIKTNPMIYNMLYKI